MHFQRIEDGRQGRVKLDIHHGPDDLEGLGVRGLGFRVLGFRISALAV